MKLIFLSAHTCESGRLDLVKMEIWTRELSYLGNRNTDVVNVSCYCSGRSALRLEERPGDSSNRLCASVGSKVRLMMIYQKLFSEHNQIAGQIFDDYKGHGFAIVKAVNKIAYI